MMIQMYSSMEAKAPANRGKALDTSTFVLDRVEPHTDTLLSSSRLKIEQENDVIFLMRLLLFFIGT